MICDNVPPYVDHAFAFGGQAAAEQRFAALQKGSFRRSIDNSVALHNAQLRPLERSPFTFDSPLTTEQNRRMRVRLAEAAGASSKRRRNAARL